VNYYKHHIGDYAAATAHLSLLEDAVYSRLLRIYYATEKPIPPDARAVYRLVRAASRSEREAVDVVLVEFFVLEDDGYHQKRADEEIAQHQTQAAINRELGKRGGRPRVNKTESVNSQNRIGLGARTETVSENNPSHKPLAISHKPEKDQKQGRASAPELPEWLPEPVWREWHDFRNTRKGWTPKARELSLRTLTELHGQGHDPHKVIEQSIERGWTGLFPPKPPDANPRGSPKPAIAQDFSAKTYIGTPENELPDFLRTQPA
jgi:uncharacterized protein YdaU (DUF1376 family)